MGRIPRDIIDAVRDRTDIAAVVSRHVKLQRRGASMIGLCPFHNEKTPSFNVVPGKQMYHCFGCNKGGDVFRFLMEVEGLSFVEAVKELAGPAGIVIEEQELTAEQRRAIKGRATAFEVLEEAAQFYESTLWTQVAGQPGRDYLRERAIDEELARKARIGFAAEGWSRLLDHLHRKGFEANQVLEAGLARQRNSGDGHYDFFRGRLMFPIRDERNRVIGFGGRILEGDGPKYVNTPETRLYDKRRVLYGIEAARSAIQRMDRVVIVEGYFDVLAMQAAGHDEAVATCGTSLTPEHLERLRRLTRNVVMLTDGDNAGRAASERALPLLVDAGLHAFRVELPDAKDPDEFVKANGPEALSDALEQRQSLVEWVVSQKVMAYADKTSMGAMSTSMARERILGELLPLLSKMPQSWVPRFAGLLRVPEGEILKALGQRERPNQPGPPRPSATGWRPVRDMVHILWLLVHRYDQIADLLQRVPTSVFADHPQVHTALARLLTGEHPANVLEEEADEGVRRTLAAIVARDELYTERVAAQGLCDMLDNLARPRLMARKTWLQHRLAEIQRSGNTADLRQVLVENQQLTASMSAMDAHREAERFGAFVEALADRFEAMNVQAAQVAEAPVAHDAPEDASPYEAPPVDAYDEAPPMSDEDPGPPPEPGYDDLPPEPPPFEPDDGWVPDEDDLPPEPP